MPLILSQWPGVLESDLENTVTFTQGFSSSLKWRLVCEVGLMSRWNSWVRTAKEYEFVTTLRWPKKKKRWPLVPNKALPGESGHTLVWSQRFCILFVLEVRGFGDTTRQCPLSLLAPCLSSLCIVEPVLGWKVFYLGICSWACWTHL